MHDDSFATDSLAALLAWYRDMGVDEAVGTQPVDWLAHGQSAPGADVLERLRPREIPPVAASPSEPPRPAVAPRAAPATPPLSRTPLVQAAVPARSFPSAPPDVSQQAARTAAARAASLADLERALHGFDGCGLKATAKNLCLYRGATRARVMLIGEAPGRDEDLAGKPFVGPAGQLLDRMLASIGLDETNVHITNIVYWRPPGNRTPTPQEAQACRPFLERQVELVAPELVVLLGGAAAKHVLDVAEGIMRIRGKWRELEIGTTRVRVIPTLHPAYLLRTPAGKRLAWRDLLAIRAQLDAAP
jgi:uracil-DNA glycosylase family 4